MPPPLPDLQALLSLFDFLTPGIVIGLSIVFTGVPVSRNHVDEWGDDGVIEVLKGFEDLDNVGHGGASLGLVAEASVGQLKGLERALGGKLALESGVYDSVKLSWVLEQRPRPFHKALLPSWSCLVHRPLPRHHLQQHHSKAEYIAHCCQMS